MMAADSSHELAMLRILYGACSAALDAFCAADTLWTNNSLSTLRKW